MEPDLALINETCHCGNDWSEHRISAYGQVCAVSCDGRSDYGDGPEECSCVRWIALDKVPADVRPFPGQKPHPLAAARFT
jgi:hypothetical protein